MLMASERAFPVSLTTVSMISSCRSITIFRARSTTAARSFIGVAAQEGCAALALAMALATSSVLAQISSPVTSMVTGLRSFKWRRESLDSMDS